MNSNSQVAIAQANADQAAYEAEKARLQSQQAVAYAQPVQEATVVQQSVQQPPPAAISGPPIYLTLTRDHIVDESNPSYAQFSIISCRVGEMVRLNKGDLIHGLGGSLKDYVEVEHQGRLGKVSRLCVEIKRNSPPP